MIEFFSKDEENRIIQTIREAEKKTSGEIRVHLERNYEGSLLGSASRIFYMLGMEQTKNRNGVLIFIVPDKKEFAIFGDRGINEKVPANFWEEVRNAMQSHFWKAMFAEGVCQGVRLAGEKLKEHFPGTKDDKNELPDEISYGK